MKTAFVRAGFVDPTLVLRWEEIAGSETAALAQPIKLSEGPSGGVLTLKAEPGAALFLQHESRSLCERINAYLGRPAVALRPGNRRQAREICSETTLQWAGFPLRSGPEISRS